MLSFKVGRSRVILTVFALLLGAPVFAADCRGLLHASLPHTQLTTADLVPAGKFTPPYSNPIEGLPAFCRVAGIIKPTTDSYISFEVWLPASGWNDKYLGVGNGGFAGQIDYRSMAANVKKGYATAATDTGHQADGSDASWAYHHPEKVVDFGYRALHLTTENAKRLTQTFYERAPGHSYFDSCSDGGREALMEAQRFPEDFDGILAGAPANYWTHMLTGGIEGAKGLYGNPAAFLSSLKLPAITAAVMAACDAQDGVKDGILNNPPACRFNPSTLLCKGTETRECLTAPQVVALKAIYSGGHDSHGKPIFPGFTPGGETGWSAWLTGPAPGASYASAYLENYFRYMVYEDPAWNPLTANADAAGKLADQKTAHALNSTESDLRPFQARGGKLILYHGWSDPAISPLNTINYYNSVVAGMGRPTAARFLRLYMVPGMGHCSGGPGPSSFGQLGRKTAKGEGMETALEHWVEQGVEPASIVATKYANDEPNKAVEMTRPLCPFPQIAKYAGSGGTGDAANWSCAAP